jgi:hypothetical protein
VSDGSRMAAAISAAAREGTRDTSATLCRATDKFRRARAR